MSCDVKFSDFDTICRVCMKTNLTLNSITCEIIEKLKACASANITSNDGLPQQICNSCQHVLKDFYNFRQLCSESETKLQQILLEKHDSQNKDFCNPLEDDISTDLNTTPEIKSTFSCEKCYKTLETIWGLGQHMKRVHKVEGTKCKSCSQIFYHPLQLQTHSHLECSNCHKSFSNRHKLDRHKLMHELTRPFECSECSSSFKDKWVLKKHIKTMHQNPSKYVNCHVCHKSVVTSYLTQHLQTHEDRTIIKCSICEKDFLHHSSLQKHIKRVHENIVPDCDFLCNICGRSLRSSSELKAHLLTHTKEKPFKCEQCSKKYRTKSALMTHISRVHLDERNFICQVCKKGFYEKKILENHMRTHTKERPFKCSICDKAFSFKIVLKTHMKVHMK